MSSAPTAPIFTSQVPGLSASASTAVAQRGIPTTLNLDDIFGDVCFTPDGDTVFMGEQEGGNLLASGEREVANVASKPQGNKFLPVPQAGGIQTTNQLVPGLPSLSMGPATGPVTTVPFSHPPQQPHHMQFATSAMVVSPQQQKKNRSLSTSSRSAERRMSEQQKVERR